MVAGGSAARRAQEARRQERLLREQWRAATREAERWERADQGERRIAAQLLVLTERGWRLLVDRRWPGTRAANVDMLLVGPAGVFVIDVKNWRADPEVVDGVLRSSGESREEHVRKLLAVTRAAEDALADLGMSPVAVQPLMVFAGKTLDIPLGRVHLLGEREVGPRLLRGRARITDASIRAMTAHLARVFPEYEGTSVAPEPTDTDTDTGTESGTRKRALGRANGPTASREVPAAVSPAARPVENLGLFDLDAMRDAALDDAMRAPIEQWMTFLHPDQLSLVRRDWAGPARISGPAGTGKTVVGLHRAAYLAERTAGRVLYATFASNLPRVQATFLASMAPRVASRVEFHSVHAWAADYLRRQGVRVNLHKDKAETAFSLAWKRAGRDTVLPELGPDSHYWREEIAHVIKGRGLTSFAQYAVVPRRRRRTNLRRVHREAVWTLYETYEAIREERGVHDFDDLLSLALAEVRRTGDRPYAAVVVDEVQDLTLVGVKLLHALVGEAPNGLLLIGDGQQAVYPGGFRLSDAGIDIRGDRGQVLRTNYRNRKPILDAALDVVASDSFEEIDGLRLSGKREVDLTHHDGVVEHVDRRTPREHDQALVEALLALDEEQRASSAVLCPSLRAIGHYQRLLTRAGVGVCPLERYDGHPTPDVKLGSYRRAKGLEFKRVYLPRYDTAVPDAGDQPSDAARERRELERSQLFVAMTRARDVLWLGSVRETGA
ncbi:NERD nuclease [Streptomyces sp. ICBB 8177]|nr:NERD nuclease [Streptomyces sp. ICBB 8177]